LHASQGAVLFVSSGGTATSVYSAGTATFASTPPANSFSANRASYNNYGKCYKHTFSTITGSCY
jgi:hypothetical protein